MSRQVTLHAVSTLRYAALSRAQARYKDAGVMKVVTKFDMLLFLRFILLNFPQDKTYIKLI